MSIVAKRSPISATAEHLFYRPNAFPVGQISVISDICNKFCAI